MLVRLADDLRWRCPIGWNVLPDAPGDMPVPAPGRRFRPFSGLLAYGGGSHRGGKWRGWATWSDSTLPAGFCRFRRLGFCGKPVWVVRAWPCAGSESGLGGGPLSFHPGCPVPAGAGRDAPALWTSCISLPGVW